MQGERNRGLQGVVQSAAGFSPRDRDGISAAGDGNGTRSLRERAGVQFEIVMHGAAIEARLQAEQPAGELPRGAAGPLVAVTPTGIEDLDPSRAAAAERPAPAPEQLFQTTLRPGDQPAYRSDTGADGHVFGDLCGQHR